jgi:hypothetical protein
MANKGNTVIFLPTGTGSLDSRVFFLFSAVRRKSFDQNWIVHRCFQRSNYVSRKDFGVHYGDEEDGGHAQGEENLVFGSDAPVDRPARYAVAETNSI